MRIIPGCLISLGIIMLVLIPCGGLADKRIGVSPPNYDYVVVAPFSTFSGGFTAFNQGDEDLLIYAEARNAPGNITIEWMYAPDEWHDTPEFPVVAGGKGYGRYIIQLGRLIQGQFYNWTIVCGYLEMDPSVSVVAQAGFRINMIWPLPPPEPLSWYQHTWIQIIGLSIGGAFIVTTLIVRKIQEINRREPLYVSKDF